MNKKMLNLLWLVLFLLLVACNIQNSDNTEVANSRYPILFNMVHHNPGEPRFNTKYTEPTYIKELGYNGQVPKFEIQCAVTYDDYEDNLVPDNTPEKMWIERKAADVRIMLPNAKRTGIPMYPFMDVCVVPQSVMDEYGDFLRGLPFNKTLGIGKHQQIVEVSMNQAGMYGRNAHPYYIGKGVLEGWPEMEEKKGLRDLFDSPQVKGVWTWGDGWFGPYFGNEFWMDLNEYVIRQYTLHPKKTEEELFNEYATSELNMTPKNISKVRKLCLLSVEAVFKGQANPLQYMQPWWIRDHFFSAQDMSPYVKKGIAEEVLAEKKENLNSWYQMEEIVQSISFPNKGDEAFLKVSTTYGRIKYELIALVFRTQIMFAQMELEGKTFDSKEAKLILKTYSKKWDEWLTLKKENPCCPTLYVDYAADHCQRNEPFVVSIKKLKCKVWESINLGS